MPKPATPASLATYAGASGATILVWTLAKGLGIESRWVAVGLGVFFAAAMQAFSEPLAMTGVKKWIAYGALLLVNTAVLSSSALGINEAVNPSG